MYPNYRFFLINLGKNLPVFLQYFSYFSGNIFFKSFSSFIINKCHIGWSINAQIINIQLFNKTANPKLKKVKKAAYKGWRKYFNAPVVINVFPLNFGFSEIRLQIMIMILTMVKNAKIDNRNKLWSSNIYVILSKLFK